MSAVDGRAAKADQLPNAGSHTGAHYVHRAADIDAAYSIGIVTRLEHEGQVCDGINVVPLKQFLKGLCNIMIYELDLGGELLPKTPDIRGQDVVYLVLGVQISN
jgi:hypothetical protein